MGVVNGLGSVIMLKPKYDAKIYRSVVELKF